MRRYDLEVLLYATVAEALGVSLADAPFQPEAPSSRPAARRRERPQATAQSHRLAEPA